MSEALIDYMVDEHIGDELLHKHGLSRDDLEVVKVSHLPAIIPVACHATVVCVQGPLDLDLHALLFDM